MNQYDEMNLKNITSILENTGKAYYHVTDAEPIKMHGTRFLLFKHSKCMTGTALAMSSIVEINFTDVIPAIIGDLGQG